jgi:uncharacterized protein YecE (DUF72 family)
LPTRIKVGVSAWTEPTLIDSGWYPPGARSAESRLRYYASQFPLAEVDAPYHALPTRRQGEAWAARTPRDFTMNVKAYALFTGHYTDPRRLPKDLQSALPPSLQRREKIYPHDLDESFITELARRFVDAIEPLRASGKLGVILLQFPAWIPNSREGREAILSARERFAGIRVAVEFRNRTWMSPANRTRTLAFLRDAGCAYTCVDEPQGFTSSVPPVAEATAEVALVRFHGRNPNTWDRRTRSAAERFDYLYTPTELAEWVPRIAHLASDVREVYAVMNNCHRDYAVRNARDLEALLHDAAGAALY